MTEIRQEATQVDYPTPKKMGGFSRSQSRKGSQEKSASKKFIMENPPLP